MNSLLLVGLPYAAVTVCVIGSIVRFRTQLTVTSRSSQILESRALAWGTIPFHLGIFVLFAGHVVPLAVPDAWRAFVSNRTALLTVETTGAAAAILCLIGLCVLFVRRVTSGAVRATSTFADVAVLAVLIAQVALGLAVASMHRWGALWAIGTTVPYLRSLIVFRPDPAFVAGVPRLMTLHLAGAWIVVALLPFTRLIHMLTFPFRYLARAPQKVVWVTRRAVTSAR